jgi:hypothetical protein
MKSNRHTERKLLGSGQMFGEEYDVRTASMEEGRRQRKKNKKAKL